MQTAVVEMYRKCCRLDHARLLFERIPDRDVASWNVVIVGFLRLGLLDKPLKFVHQMILSDLKPDLITVLSLT